MKRIDTIDFTRGLVMLIMALDHVRDLMHTTSLSQDATDLNTTTTGIFLTRWITHLCAPAFVFLSGTSAYISYKNSGNLSDTRRFLRNRGLWLIFLEFTVINFALWYDIHFRTLVMQVICAIGVGLLVLSALLKLPVRTIGIIGLTIVAGHNLLQNVAFPDNPALNFGWSVLFRIGIFPITPNFTFGVLYPLVPWLGILLTGYAFGQLFEQPLEQRRKLLLRTGLGALALFGLLRSVNFYGDSSHWAPQKSVVFSILSFFNVSKYPPSLLYTLVTLGCVLLILYVADGKKNRFLRIVSTYGKVPLFYYLVHWYVIHTVMFGVLFAQGMRWEDLNFGTLSFGRPVTGVGVELPVIYLIWGCIIVALYPLCRWYGAYKSAHPENKFLRYL